MRHLLTALFSALLGALVLQAQTPAAASYPSGAEDRAASVEMLVRISKPVMQALAENRFAKDLPVRDWNPDRARYAHIEAYARTLSGLAPWLELGPDSSPEGKLRAEMLDLTLRATRNAFDPASPDRISFESDGNRQTLVEAAYVALALFRAPNQLWGKLAPEERTRVLEALKVTRAYKPHMNNWLLFSAMVEAALWKFGDEFDRVPIETAVQTHLRWYLGDGTYGDGPEYHWDYYNSFVIHPMMLEVLKICREKQDPLAVHYDKALQRAQRYAVVQERTISPEGTYPVVGRSSAYRLACFQLLSQLILTGDAPASIANGSTRAALTAVARRLHQAPGTFDARGWLQLGVAGKQMNIRERYSNIGSLYITTNGFLHLGLPADHAFWTQPGGPWTQRRIWSGDPDAPVDAALKGK